LTLSVKYINFSPVMVVCLTGENIYIHHICKNYENFTKQCFVMKLYLLCLHGYWPNCHRHICHSFIIKPGSTQCNFCCPLLCHSESIWQPYYKFILWSGWNRYMFTIEASNTEIDHDCGTHCFYCTISCHQKLTDRWSISAGNLCETRHRVLLILNHEHQVGHMILRVLDNTYEMV